MTLSDPCVSGVCRKEHVTVEGAFVHRRITAALVMVEIVGQVFEARSIDLRRQEGGDAVNDTI
jgi:hypothetical protein